MKNLVIVCMCFVINLAYSTDDRWYRDWLAGIQSDVVKYRQPQDSGITNYAIDRFSVFIIKLQRDGLINLSIKVTNSFSMVSVLCHTNYPDNISLSSISVPTSSHVGAISYCQFQYVSNGTLVPSMPLILRGTIQPGGTNDKSLGRLTIKAKHNTSMFGGMMMYSDCYLSLLSNSCVYLSSKYFINKKPIDEGIFISGRSNGFYYEYGDDGLTSRVTFYSNGTKNGVEFIGKYFWAQFQVRDVEARHFSNGIQIGESVPFDTSIVSHWEKYDMSIEIQKFYRKLSNSLTNRNKY